MTTSIDLPAGSCWLLVPFNPENPAPIGSLGLYGQPVSITGSVIARMPDVAREAPASAPPAAPPPPRSAPPSPPAAGGDGKRRRARGISYELLGEHRTAAMANDALVDILRVLENLESGFLERLAPLAAGRTRNHIARTRALVYPRRPDLARSARELVPGWFVGTNISNDEKRDLLQQACEVLGLVFGRDLKINLG